ncbi:hypothetical protein [Bradyrhizobium cenepequi]
MYVAFGFSNVWICGAAKGLAVKFLLIVFLVLGATQAYAYDNRALMGTGLQKGATAGSCSSAVSVCISRAAGNKAIEGKCQAAGNRCRSTGTFVGPNGKSASGLQKN